MGAECSHEGAGPAPQPKALLAALKKKPQDDWAFVHSWSHSAPVLTCAFSPAGDLLAVGDAADRLVLYRVPSWVEVFEMRGDADFSSEVWSVAFDPTGIFLAAGDYYKLMVYRLDTSYFKLAVECRLDDSCDYRSVSFSPDGRLLAAGNLSNTLVVYDTQTWDIVHRLDHECDRSELWSVTFSPSGGLLAAGGDANTLAVYSVATWEVVCLLEAGGAVAFSPDSELLAASNYHYNHSNQMVSVYSASSWRLLEALPHEGAVWCVSFSPAGDLLVAGDTAKKLTVYHVASWRVVAVVDQDSDVMAAAFSANGNLLAAAQGGPGHRCIVYARETMATAIRAKALAAEAEAKAQEAVKEAELLKERASDLELHSLQLPSPGRSPERPPRKLRVFEPVVVPGGAAALGPSPLTEHELQVLHNEMARDRSAYRTDHSAVYQPVDIYDTGCDATCEAASVCKLATPSVQYR